MMIGHNFILQSSSDYNPLLDQPSGGVGKKIAFAKNLCPSFLDESEKLDDLNYENDFLYCLPKNLSEYSFYIIKDKCLVKRDKEQLIASNPESEDLEIEVLDIQRKPEKAVWAVQNQAFVALRHNEDLETLEVKLSPKWAKRLQKGKFKQFKVKDKRGESARVIDRSTLKITHFTAQEINEISDGIFKAIDMASQIKSIKQQRKETIEKKEKNWVEKKFKEAPIKGRLEAQSEQIKDSKKFFAKTNHSKLSQEKLIEQSMREHQEEVKKLEQLKDRDEKQFRIIKKEIEDFELKKEILKNEDRSREIKQAE